MLIFRRGTCRVHQASACKQNFGADRRRPDTHLWTNVTTQQKRRITRPTAPAKSIRRATIMLMDRMQRAAGVGQSCSNDLRDDRHDQNVAVHEIGKA